METGRYQQIISKQPHLKQSIFTIMTKMALKFEAINLSQGFPDFPPPAKLIELFYKHLKAGHNQYAPMPGIALLRERISEKMERCYGAVYNPETEITITAGATEANYAAITAIVNPGDEVIVFEPWYDAYIPAIEYSGGIAIQIPLQFPNYTINWYNVKKAINNKTKAIILNSPHNPTGAVLSETDMDQLTKIIKDTPILLISDEVYQHIIYDGQRHNSVSKYADLADRCFVISSFGKTFHATGWKVGYCCAPKRLTDEFQKIHQFITFSVNTPAQYAYADYIADEQHYLQLAGFYQEKRNLFQNFLGTSRFNLLPCSGTYFQLADYSRISAENDIDFAKRLTKEYKVASIPTSVFYKDGNQHKVIRFCFAKKQETLEKAAELLCRI